MTTSGVYNLDLTANEVIFEAYDILQVATDGEPTDGDLFNRALSSLNIMMKLWESQGIHLWTMTEGTLFMRVEVDKYDFNDEGFDVEENGSTTKAIHLANEFVQTALVTDATAGSNQVGVDSTIAVAGNQIGIVNNDNDLDWYTVVQVISAQLVAIDRPLDNAASGNAVVYTYAYFDSTLVTANAGGAQPTVEVADTTLFNVGDQVSLFTDMGVSQKLTIFTIDQGANTLTFTQDITGGSSIDDACINLTTRTFRVAPIKRILNDTVRRRESTDYEIPIVFQSRKDYFDLPNKNQPGTVIQTYYDRQQPQGTMYVWNPPSSAVPVLNFSYERELQILTSADDTFDLPADWFDAVVYNLAKRLIPKVGCSVERKTLITDSAKEYLDNALGFDQAVYGIRLKPMMYG